MRTVVISSGKEAGEHLIYTVQEAIEAGIKFTSWRLGRVGDWVETDDGHVVQVLWRRDWRQKNRDRGAIRTATGTFAPHCRKTQMDTRERECRHTYSGRPPSLGVRNKTQLKAFFLMLSQGHDPETAFQQTFVRYMRERGKVIKAATVDAQRSRLMNSEEVQALIKKDLQNALEANGITDNWIIRRFKSIIEEGENEPARVRALVELAKITGMMNAKQGDELGAPGAHLGAPAELLQRALDLRRQRQQEQADLPDHAGAGMNSRNLKRESLDLSANEEDAPVMEEEA